MDKSKDKGKSKNKKKDKLLLPYWDSYVEDRSDELWLPDRDVLDGVGSAGSDLLRCWGSKTGLGSWFNVSRVFVNRCVERVFSRGRLHDYIVSWDVGSDGKLNYDDVELLKSRKIRVYLDGVQMKFIRHCMSGSRFWYNEAVSLYRLGFDVHWHVMRDIVRVMSPDRFKDIPSKILGGAVYDAYKAHKAVKKKRKELSDKGISQNVELGFRNRKDAVQSFYLCNVAWNKDLTTIYPRSLGQIKLSESLSSESLSVVPKDGRFVSHNGRYYVCVPYSSPRCVTEIEGRVVALDPGIRSFLTFYSENDCGKVGEGDFGRLCRMCAHLDNLIGRRTKAVGFLKVRLGRAICRMRCRVRDLIDELHKQVSHWLVKNYDVILLPTFETSDMVVRGQRCLRSKSVRSLLTFAHYRFKTFLKHKAFEMGKMVLDVNESYTSKTVSWTGEVIDKLGGSKIIRSRIDGRVMDRDVNGARGIFLRALVDTPRLRGCLS